VIEIRPVGLTTTHRCRCSFFFLLLPSLLIGFGACVALACDSLGA
jgi:hypothetical protein